MNRLNELIQELCPNGVEYKKVKEAFRRLRGTPITAGKMKEIEDPNGEIKIFAGGKTIINAKEENIPNANITRVPAVLVQSRGIIDVVYYDKPFTFKNEMWAYTADNEIEVKYLYYVLKNDIQSFRDAASGMGSLPQISLPVTEDLRIPLPPLPVQQEIVRILDNFTELTAELTAELAARRKQYEHYREKILHAESAEIKTIMDICGQITTGKLDANAMVENGQYPFFTCNAEPYRIDTYAFDTEAILVSGNGSQIGHLNYYKGKFNAYQRTYVLSDFQGINVRYFYLYLKSYLREYIVKNSKKGSVPYITLPMLQKFKVPVPDLNTQRNIADSLGYFDNICSNLTSGLPAEIAARQKQYEYYRDKLLTFKELEG